MNWSEVIALWSYNFGMVTMILMASLIFVSAVKQMFSDIRINIIHKDKK